jgi:hypothetical protein
MHEANLVGRKGDELEIEVNLENSSPPIRTTCDFSEIIDWTVYHQNGRCSGGFTKRVMLKKARQKWGKLPPNLEAQEKSLSEQPPLPPR